MAKDGRKWLKEEEDDDDEEIICWGGKCSGKERQNIFIN